MTRKTAILLIISILGIILIGLGAFYFFFMRSGDAETSGITKTISDYFPFGKTASTGEGTNENNPQTTEQTGSDTSDGLPHVAASEPTIFRQISADPIAGATIFDKTITVTTDNVKENFDKTFIRYVERGTGHIEEVSTDSVSVKKISNTTIPRVYEAVWINDLRVVLRYLNDDENIKSYLTTILQSGQSDTPAPLTGVFLEDDIVALSSSPKKDRLFYIDSLPAQGVMYDMYTTKKTALENFPIAEFQVEWPSADLITLTTNASSKIGGYLYTLTTSGAMKKITGPVRGLLTKSAPGFLYVLWSETKNISPSLSVLDVKKNTNLPLSISTLPEKCVWGTKFTNMLYCAVPKSLNSGTFPDDWYQGKKSFTDELWSVDVQSGKTTKLYDISKDTPFDAINLSLNEKQSTLILTNKIDNSLWSFDLSSSN